MQKLKIVLGLLFLAYCGPVFSTDSASFDVPGGSTEIVFAGPLAPDMLVQCQFAVEQPVFDDGWIPSVAIFFETDEQVEDGGMWVSLAAIGSEEEQGWRYRLRVYEDRWNRGSDINVHTGATESVMQLNMILTGDEYVLFFVGEKAAEHSKIDIAPAVMTKWAVLATGITGTRQCDTRLPEVASSTRKAKSCTEPESFEYATTVVNHIAKDWTLPKHLEGVACKLRITQNEAGEILGVNFEDCPNDKEIRDSLMAVLAEAQPLPQPSNSSCFKDVITWTLEPISQSTLDE